MSGALPFADTKVRRFLAPLLAIVLLAPALSPVLVEAQASFSSAREYFEDASQLRAEGDLTATIIQLKNSLQLDEAHVPSLLLMGEVLMATGRPGQAALALSDALLLGADLSSTSILLMDAYLQSGRYGELLQNLPYERAPSGLKAEFLAANAQAYLGLGRDTEAAALIEQARELDPSNYRLGIAAVTLDVREGNLQSAHQNAQTLVEQSPNSSQAWSSYASALHLSGQTQAAIEAYGKAIDFDSGNLGARFSLATILIQLNRNEEAAVEVAYLRENFPGDPRATYYEALLAAREGDAEREKLALEETLLQLDDIGDAELLRNVQLAMIATLSNYGLGNFTSALAHLERYLLSYPDDIGAVRLKAITLLRLDKHQYALQELRKLRAQYPNDQETIVLMASAHRAAGDYDRAAELLDQIDTGATNTTITTTRGLNLLSAGNLVDGIEALETVARADSEQSTTALPLAIAYMRVGRWSDALDILQPLSELNPNDDNLTNLVSLALMGAGDSTAAEALMRDLMERSPDFLPPRINLAKTAINEGRLEEAEELLKYASRYNPDNPSVVFELARLTRAQGNNELALKHAERATELSDNIVYSGFLVDLYLFEDERVLAEEAASKASQRSNDPFQGSLLYGQTLIRLGKPKEAALLYTQMSRAADFDADRLLVIAEQQSQIGEHNSAFLTLEAALKSAYLDPLVRRAHFREQIQVGSVDEGIKLANDYIRDFPGDAVGHLMLGDLRLRLGQTRKADPSYRAAIKLGASNEGYLGLYRSKRIEGNLSGALSAIQPGLTDENIDPSLMAANADVLMELKRWQDADRALTNILEAYPDSWVHWNNRAYVRQQLGRAEAENDAREALLLAPQSPEVNDTLGWILVRVARSSDALEYLREATARDRDNPLFRYHLGAALADLGRTQEARRELNFALQADIDWNAKEDARALLAGLRPNGN